MIGHIRHKTTGVNSFEPVVLFVALLERALHEESDFSVQPLCLCVSVVVFTNNSLTTEAQRHREEV